jgi:hypothetical protein
MGRLYGIVLVWTCVLTKWMESFRVLGSRLTCFERKNVVPFFFKNDDPIQDLLVMRARVLQLIGDATRRHKFPVWHQSRYCSQHDVVLSPWNCNTLRYHVGSCDCSPDNPRYARFNPSFRQARLIPRVGEILLAQ